MKKRKENGRKGQTSRGWLNFNCVEKKTCGDHNLLNVPLTASVTCGDFLNHNFGGDQNPYHARDHICDLDHSTYHDLGYYDHNPSRGHDYPLDHDPDLLPSHDPCLVLCPDPYFVLSTYRAQDKGKNTINDHLKSKYIYKYRKKATSYLLSSQRSLCFLFLSSWQNISNKVPLKTLLHDMKYCLY